MTTLYLKYRPQNLDDLDLENVRNTLKNMVKSGSIPHALLFCGPRGSGKTSAARILAKIVNCESKDVKKRGKGLENPCNECEQCKSITQGTNIDVIELDAASHRGIDDVRTLRDAVKLSPAKANKKVYIIDEAHMLTTEASNALLKTLEEPPSHVIFILATTNPEKLIETIRSRTAIVNFTKAKIEELVGSLQQVIDKEKIKASSEVLQTVAEYSDGSFRDAKKILEQLVNEGIIIDPEKVIEYLTNNIKFNLVKFFENLSERNIKNAINQIEVALNSGMQVSSITDKVMQRLHGALLSENGLGGEKIPGFEVKEIISLINRIAEKLVYQSYAVVEQLPLELAISEWGRVKVNGEKSNVNNGNGENNNKANGKPKVSEELRDTSEDETAVSKSKKKAVIENPGLENFEGDEFGDDLWTRVLTLVRPKNPSTEALLRAAKPMKISDQSLFLGVYYSFHKEKLESIQHKSLLEETLENILGKKIKVQCYLTDPPLRKTADDFKAPEYIRKSPKTGITTNGNNGNSGYNFKEPGNGKPDDHEVLLTEPDDEDIIKLAEEIFGK
ncbi:MAG TPA: DNA polymerase III subunit gamma/tau [Patescibacteria group bacterium]|nr:DNA polymerase III subunit gamma/tau [Patescibacteria group bacterium]